MYLCICMCMYVRTLDDPYIHFVFLFPARRAAFCRVRPSCRHVCHRMDDWLTDRAQTVSRPERWGRWGLCLLNRQSGGRALTHGMSRAARAT